MSATVGRESELQLLAGLLSQVGEGKGATCFVTGEAGSGKSTLVAEFVKRSLEARADVIVAIGSCDAHVGIGDPYLPFLDVLSELTGTIDAKAQQKLPSAAIERLRKFAGPVAEFVLEFTPDLIGTLIPGAGLLAKFVGLTAQKSGITDRLKRAETSEAAGTARIDQDQIFKNYTNLLVELTKRQPVIVILDDLHWADASSCALLGHLSRAMADARLLLLGTYRPNDIDVGTGAGDGRHPMDSIINELKRHHGDIFVNLDQHSEARRRAFVRELINLEPNDISDEWCSALFSHTHGHALFTVELLRALKERGVLELTTDRGWVAPKVTNWNVLPTRVEGVIEERIGRLDTRLHDILRIGSIEGEVFTAEVVARVLQIEESKLHHLLNAELIGRHRLLVEGDVRRIGRSYVSQFAFNHALFQQYLYDRLGRRQRMLWHRQVGELLEELYQDRTDEVAAQLARHFVAAGDAEKAFDYLLNTANRSMRVSAYKEVIAQVATALEMAERLEKDRYSRELDAVLIRAAAEQADLGWAAKETIETLARGRVLAAQLPPNERMVPLLFGQFAGLITQGRYAEAYTAARELDEGNYTEAENGGLTVAVTLGVATFWLGRIVEGREASLQGLDCPSTVGGVLNGNRLRVILLRQLMLDEFLLGNDAESTGYRDQMIAVADASADPFLICLAHGGVAWDAYQRREPVETRAAVERALQAGVENYPFYYNQLLVFRWWTEGISGDGEAVARLDQSFADLSTGGDYFYSVYIAMKTELLRRRGALDEALACVDAGTRHAEEVSDLVYLSELHRHRGDVLRDLGRDDEAAASYRSALEMARLQQLKVFVDRAAEGRVKGEE